MEVAVRSLLAAACVLVLARVLRRGLERVGQPAVMAEVLAGLVLGLLALEAVFAPDVREVLKAIGTVGVVLYLFGVGVQLSARRQASDTGAAGRVAAASFVVPLAGGVLLALAIRPQVESGASDTAFALFLGTALAVTAFPVLARIVEQRGLVGHPAGRVALGAAAAQEFLVWPLLAVVISGSAQVLVTGTLAVAAVVVAARTLMPRVPEAARPAALAVSLAAAASATHLAGVHVILGAFVLGAALAPSARPAARSLTDGAANRVALAVSLPLFFAVPALTVDLAALADPGALGLLAAVLAVAVVTKVVSAAVAARMGGLGARDALTVGALMNARGLVELVVLSIGRDAGLIDDRLYAVLVVMALITTFATGPVVGRLRPRAIMGSVTPAREYRDIESREDCETLVRAFYSRAFHDPVIGFIFTDVAKLDLEAHVPVITSFWETLLLDAHTYDRGAFHPHAALHRKVELREGHFTAWLNLWYATVNELYAGPRAEMAKAHAYRLGNAFRMRLASQPSAADDAPGGFAVTQHG